MHITNDPADLHLARVADSLGVSVADLCDDITRTADHILKDHA